MIGLPFLVFGVIAASWTLVGSAWLCLPSVSLASPLLRRPVVSQRFARPGIAKIMRLATTQKGVGFASPPEKNKDDPGELAKLLVDAAMGEAGVDASEYMEEKASAKKPLPPGMLPGPPKPPAAPATYKALQKIRLRIAPGTTSDLTWKEIEKGAVFRAIASQDDETTPGIIWLKTDDDYDGGWLLDTGIIGDFRGKKVVKRVGGSLASQKRSAVLEISAIDNAEALPPGTKGNDSEAQQPNDGGFQQGEQQRAPVLSLLDDPQMTELCKSMGISADDLKANPEFLRSVARRLYGDEVVS